MVSAHAGMVCMVACACAWLECGLGCSGCRWCRLGRVSDGVGERGWGGGVGEGVWCGSGCNRWKGAGEVGSD